MKLTLEQEKNISDRFVFLWGEYNKIINLCITLSVGTLLIFANNILLKDNLENFRNTHFLLKYAAYASIGFIFIGLLFTIIWRILSQVYMEREVFGNEEIIEGYLNNINQYEHAYSFNMEKKDGYKKRFFWKLSQYLSFSCLLMGWLCFLIFFLGFLNY